MKIAEEDRFFKELLYFKNLFKAGLIGRVEHDRRVREEEEEEKRQMAGGRPMSEATRRRLEGQGAPKQTKNQSPRPKKKKTAGSEGASADEMTMADRRREKKVAEAEAVREVHQQMTSKRMIEGALDATPLPKRPKGPNEGTSVLIPDDEGEGEEGPVNIACSRKAVPFINCMIDGAQMELSEIEQLSMKTLREQTGRAFRLQAAGEMEMWLCAKRAMNAAERYQKRFEEGRSKIADAGKMLQEADRRAEENAAKIAELAAKLAATELEVVAAQEARAAVEVAMDAAERSHVKELGEAKAKSVADYRASEEFTRLVDKEVMEQCDDFVYRFKRYNADKKLNLNFLRDPPPLPEGVTEEMVEAYKGEDAEPVEADETESSSEEEEGHPGPRAANVSPAEPSTGPVPVSADADIVTTEAEPPFS
ncbi:eukaryotic translation initiation factor 5B-like [Prunus avium]|uniref:Eukaryotic translation initiation factor 5B-like n=1 Tax=Prunus avium TaxID=42229 RepID=A0A6P5U0L2_PRUAV|nr:eukaryotic translation initiation factor 5B-like [Prunus avium]